MGDVLMSTPAIRAVKETLNCKLTLLTSSRGEEVAQLIPEIDHVISFNFPWVQNSDLVDASDISSLVEKIKTYNFDGCIVFSVYSQNSLPAALIAYLANIPFRLAYCRENPYGLLTHWLPDREPYSFILHQVNRDLMLVGSIGAHTDNKKLSLGIDPNVVIKTKIKKVLRNFPSHYFVLHPGVSDEKRKYPFEGWVSLGKSIRKEYGIPLFVTGSYAEKQLVKELVYKIGTGTYSLAGLLTIEETAFLIQNSKALISVNTGVIHIAAAVQTPVVVLYAQSNPQHFPWMVKHICLEFSIPENLKSRNEVISFVNDIYYKEKISFPSSKCVLNALKKLVDID
jgi:ADP-heptose:LPS heptosyltransferase